MDRSGQSVMEMALLILVILAALLASQVYMKRGLQGAYHSAAVSMGGQYDPEATNSSYTMTHVSNVETASLTLPPVTAEKYSCAPGYAPYPKTTACTYWNETVSQSSTTIRTVYDNLTKTGSETVGAIF